MAALEDVAASLPLVFPTHPRTRKALEEARLTQDTTVVLTEPLPYRSFLSLEANAAAVITDSGGVPEETTVLGVRCFTLRDNTERPVTVELGTNTVIGQEPEALRDVPALLREPRAREIPPLWDGHAGERAADAVERLFSAVEVPA
jgi:UDP-N-acetylglucosamine 2-epimerase (non-hydrolysing)